MKYLKRVVFVIIFVLGIMGTCINAQAKPKAKPKKYDVCKEVKKLQNGWNLGHSFDTGDSEIAMNNPLVTKELITAIKEAGYKTIRIPITWEGHFDAYHKSYVINNAFFKRLDDVINMCLKQDLNVCINMQSDSWRWFARMKKKDDTYYKMYSKLWNQIAKHYKNYSEKLIFESMDKPYFQSLSVKKQKELLNQVNQSFIKIVRKTGGKNKKRLLGVATLNSSISKSVCQSAYDGIKKQKDKRVFVTVHYYGPWNFSVNAEGATSFTDAVAKQVREKFDILQKIFYKKKVPVVCTEYGLLGYDCSYNGLQHGDVLRYMEYVNYYARKKKVVLMLWDNGSIFDRTNLKYKDDDLAAVIASEGKIRSSFADHDAIYRKQEEASEDVTYKLCLNGNKLVSVSDTKRQLVQGTDYDVDKNKITFKKSYFESIHKSECKQVETITLNFDNGNPFTIAVYIIKPPVISPAKGNEEDGMIIPVKLYGNRLIKMSSVYEKKGTVTKKVKKKKVKEQVVRNAGPLKYTPYQEYSHSFYESKDGKSIVLTGDYVQSLKSEKVNLNFYFADGETVSYDIIKEKDKVKEINYTEPVITETPTATAKAIKVAKKKEAEKLVKKASMNTKKNLVLFLIAGFVAMIGILYIAYHRKNNKKSC